MNPETGLMCLFEEAVKMKKDEREKLVAVPEAIEHVFKNYSPEQRIQYYRKHKEAFLPWKKLSKFCANK